MNQTPQESSAQDKPQQKPKLRWFQFGLRTLGIVMTALCVGLAWLIHDVREQEAVVKMIEEQGGYVAYGAPSFLGRIWFVHTLFGEDAFEPITGVNLPDGTDSHIVKLKKLRKLRWLLLYGTKVSDLTPLSELTELRFLLLQNTSVTDLSPLAGLNELTRLDLTGTQVSDLSSLAGLNRLTNLYLNETRVSDLSQLVKLSGLTDLDIRDTSVSDLSPLAGLSGLTTLDLRDTLVTDLSPLARMLNLKAIYLGKDQEVLIPESLEKVVQEKVDHGF